MNCFSYYYHYHYHSSSDDPFADASVFTLSGLFCSLFTEVTVVSPSSTSRRPYGRTEKNRMPTTSLVLTRGQKSRQNLPQVYESKKGCDPKSYTTTYTLIKFSYTSDKRRKGTLKLYFYNDFTF